MGKWDDFAESVSAEKAASVTRVEQARRAHIEPILRDLEARLRREGLEIAATLRARRVKTVYVDFGGTRMLRTRGYSLMVAPGLNDSEAVHWHLTKAGAWVRLFEFAISANEIDHFWGTDAPRSGADLKVSEYPCQLYLDDKMTPLVDNYQRIPLDTALQSAVAKLIS